MASLTSCRPRVKAGLTTEAGTLSLMDAAALLAPGLDGVRQRVVECIHAAVRGDMHDYGNEIEAAFASSLCGSLYIAHKTGADKMRIERLAIDHR